MTACPRDDRMKLVQVKKADVLGSSLDHNNERNIMETKQLKRIADALEEILRLVKKDMAEMKKAAK